MRACACTLSACLRACVRSCVRAFVRACARARVCVCVVPASSQTLRITRTIGLCIPGVHIHTASLACVYTPHRSMHNGARRGHCMLRRCRLLHRYPLSGLRCALHAPGGCTAPCPLRLVCDVSIDRCELLQKVKDSALEIFKTGSYEPAAQLHEASTHTHTRARAHTHARHACASTSTAATPTRLDRSIDRWPFVLRNSAWD